MPRPARGALVWRLYVLGFIQIVLLAAAVVEIGHLIRPPPPEWPPDPWPPLLTFLFSGLVIVGVGA